MSEHRRRGHVRIVLDEVAILESIFVEISWSIGIYVYFYDVSREWKV